MTTPGEQPTAQTYSQADVDALIAAAVAKVQTAPAASYGPVVTVIKPGTERELWDVILRHIHFHNEVDARFAHVTVDALYPQDEQ